MDFYSLLGQFTRDYTQTVKLAADNKRRYAPGEGSIPPVLLSGESKGAWTSGQVGAVVYRHSAKIAERTATVNGGAVSAVHLDR